MSFWFSYFLEFLFGSYKCLWDFVRSAWSRSANITHDAIRLMRSAEIICVLFTVRVQV